ASNDSSPARSGPCSAPYARPPPLLDRYRSVNAVAESFFATIKTELLHRETWPTRTAAHTAIFNWIEGWYNTRRRHSTLGYLSPAAYEATAHTNTISKVA
ncbi:IS3 family transposase, partial [Polymorphospora rubra]|uniref:IS3 family transposase n=1 Tax=Polymorphospora rubra TaxID=338584 RepID=UPI0033D26F1A